MHDTFQIMFENFRRKEAMSAKDPPAPFEVGAAEAAGKWKSGDPVAPGLFERMRRHRLGVPLYIFDLDGTLALCEHRKHWLEQKDNPDRWRRFYAECDKDEPNIPVLGIMDVLRLTGADVWVFSGRSAEVRGKTIDWLARHTSFMSWQWDTALMMRREGDHRPDDELKKEMLDSMLIDDRQRLRAVFDDRDRVVKMWRENGVTCFQVAPGAF
jgi:hypothetical protein